MTYLTVTLNNRCNLACSYCNQRDHLDPNDNTELTVERFREVLDETSGVNIISLLGGELMLNKGLVLDCVKEVRKHEGHRDVILLIHTNGYLLDYSAVEWINHFGCGVYISCDGFERQEKSLSSLFHKGEHGAEIIPVLRSLDTLNFRRVLSNPFENFALSLHTLHSLFPHARCIELCYDDWKLGELNIQHLYHASRQLLMLEEIDENYTDWLRFVHFWGDENTAPCDCKKSYYLWPDGELTSIHDRQTRTIGIANKESNVPFGGCASVADRMTMENFSTWRSHIQAMMGAAKVRNNSADRLAIK